MTLPQKTIERIKSESEVYANTFKHGIEFRKHAYADGGIFEATRSMEREKVLVDALKKIIQMNRQQAIDQYGDAEKAETWSCVIVARKALTNYAGEGERRWEND